MRHSMRGNEEIHFKTLMLQTRTQKTVLKIESTIKDLSSDESDFQKAIELDYHMLTHPPVL